MIPVAPLDGRSYFGDIPAAKRSELDMETFMRLLTVQLVNQNPTEPMNDRDFFAQMAQLGQVQGLDKLQGSVDMAQAASLIGKTVTAVRPFTTTGGSLDAVAFGVVERITVHNGERMIGIRELDGGLVEVKMSAIQMIAG